MIVLSSATYDSGALDDKALGLTIDPAGNIFITGTSGSDYLSLKYSKTLVQGPAQPYVNGASANIPGGIAVDGLGNILVAGMEEGPSSQDYLLLKYASNFSSLVSSAAYDGGYYDRATALLTDDQNNVFVTGFSNDGTTDNFYTIKYNSSLIKISTADFESGDMDQAYAMTFSGSDLIVAGFTKTGGTNYDVRLIRYDGNLNQLPSPAPFDTGSDDRGVGLAVDSGGNIIVLARQVAATANFLLLKYDSALTTLLSSAVYDSGGADSPAGVAVDSSDNIIVTGSVNPGTFDYLTVKYDSSLNIISTASYDGGLTDQVNAIAVDPDDNVVITGQTYGSTFDYFTIKYNASPVISEVTPLYIGETSNVTLTGKGLLADTLVAFTDTAISTGAASYNSGQITLSVTPSTAVILGITTITVTNSNGEYYTSASLPRTRLRQTIPAGQSAAITAVTKLGSISISVPSGSFPLQETITLSPEAAASGDIQQVGEALFVAGTPSTSSLANMTVTLRYSVADLGTYPEGSLSLAYYDTASGWVTLPSSVNTSAKTVTAVAKAASNKYAVIKAVSSGGGGGGGAGGSGVPAKVYPNPYRPGSGGSFDQSDLGAGIVFAGLTAGQAFKLTILDLAGQLVYQKSAAADGAGRYLWDTKTVSGGEAASGVYLYTITGSGEPRKGKFSIIR